MWVFFLELEIANDLILVILGLGTKASNYVLGYWPLAWPCPLHPEYFPWMIPAVDSPWLGMLR